MSEPVRLQLSRRRGFDLQKLSRETNGLPAVKVARPGRFGNPFTLEDATDIHDCGRESAHAYAAGWFREWLTQPDDHHDQTEFGSYGWLKPRREKLLARLPELQGKNLACFCRRSFACHADVLLELANRPACDTPPAPIPRQQGAEG